jgi:ABC-type nitrate/sulfonate/bicarbonate transport system substrate-binding protein
MNAPFLSTLSTQRTAPSRRRFLQASAILGGAVAMPSIVKAASVPVIRYASAGVVGPGEIETVIFSEYFKANVLKRYGKEYTLEATTAKGTPGVATLLAATLVQTGGVAGGVSAIAAIHQDGVKGYASNPFVVLEDSPIKTVADFKGKTVAVNAFNGSVDIILRLALEKAGLDPKRDVRVVEMPFGNIGPALRQKRIDVGVLAMPFQVQEKKKGGIRFVFDAVGVVPPYPVLFQAARNQFLKTQGPAVKAWLADFVEARAWIYDPANRKTVVKVTAELIKSPEAELDEYFLKPADFYRDVNACISVSDVQAPVDAMHKLGLLPNAVSLAKSVDPSFLPAACKL